MRHGEEKSRESSFLQPKDFTSLKEAVSCLTSAGLKSHTLYDRVLQIDPENAAAPDQV